MSQEQPNNPLHGITLKTILEDLVRRRGWSYLADQIEIRCFMFDPTIRSSLKFLRKNEWARTKLEALYLYDHEVREKTKDEKTSGTSEVHDSLPSTD